MKHIELPMPPSVSDCYSIEHEAWVAEAERAFGGRKIRIKGNEWIMVQYTFFFPLSTKKEEIREIENYIKPVSDFLAQNIEGFESSKIKRIIIEKEDAESEGVVIVISELI